MPVTCYESSEPVLTQIYDPNGNALSMGEIVEFVNTMEKENRSLRKEVNELRAALGWGRKYVEWGEIKSGGCPTSGG